MSQVQKYHLTKEEISNLQGRKQFLGYLKDLTERDMSMYLYTNVIKRLNLPDDVKFTLSEDSEWIEIDVSGDKESH